jgi:hypothetical protein
MNNPLRGLVVFIVLFAAVLYIGGIVWAGIASCVNTQETPPTLPEIVTHAITSIGAVLATHFGALFGISQFTGGNPRPIPSFLQIHIWARLPSREKRPADKGVPAAFTAGVPTPEPPSPRPYDLLQVVAAYFYFFSLLLALVFWAATGFSPRSADVVKNLSFTLVGVMAAIGTISLSVRK